MKLLLGGLLVLAAFVPSISYAQYTWCEGADDVHATIADHAILLLHQAAEYNCCPDSFTYSVSQQGDVLYVTEFEQVTIPCYCLCCYELGTTIRGVAPGDYEIHFAWYDVETWTWVTEILPITVPEDVLPAPHLVADAFASECLEGQSVPEPGAPDDPPAETWGRIKTLFGHRVE